MNKRRNLYLIVLLLIGVALLLCIDNLLSYDQISYDSVDELSWYPGRMPEVGFNVEGTADSTEEACRLFFTIIQEQYSPVSRMLDNDMHVFYDSAEERYYLFYRGNFFDKHEMYAFVEKGSSIIYAIIGV